MEDYREAQRKKWEKAKQEQELAGSASAGDSGASASNGATSNGAPVASSVSTATASSTFGAGTSSTPATMAEASAANGQSEPATASSTSGNPTRHVRKVHILPVGAESDVESESRLGVIANELRRKRSAKEPIKAGTMIRDSGKEFVVVKCEPEDGVLGTETDFFVEGEPVVRFEKVQFIGLWDFQSNNVGEDSARLFAEYVSPYFRSLHESGGAFEAIVRIGETLKIFDMEFQVMAALPSPPEVGIVDINTMVYVDWDNTPEFSKIHIVPFQDTLPNAYEYDIFSEYLKPYLTRYKHMRLSQNDQFTFQGVQFKVVCCEPNGPARIGKSTMIYCEGTLHPSLRNLLPPDLLEQLAHLPPGLQMLLLNTEALAGGYEERIIEVQDMLSRRRGLAPEMLDLVEQYTWDPDAPGSQTQCMVCLCDFERGEEVRRLPCTHVFHASCIGTWLHRCAECPICKTNVDRAIDRGADGGSSSHNRPV